MTKEIDFVMPYGVTMRGKGDMVPEIVGEHEKKVNVVAIALPAGPCRIAASWDGPQSVTIRVYSGGRFRSVIAEIPSGGGCAPSWSPMVLSRGTGCRWARPLPLPRISAGRSKCTHSQPGNASSRGGGVDDGRIRQHAAHSVIRGNISREWDRALQRRPISGIARGGLHSLRLKQNRHHDHFSMSRAISVGAVLVNCVRARGDQSDPKHCGPERRWEVPKYPHERRRPRYRPDDYHLPALNTTGGGTLNDDTTRSRLDARLGHQACQYGRQHAGPDSGRSRVERHAHRFLATCRCTPAHAGFRRGSVDVDLPRVANAVRDAGTAQGPHRPSHHGHGGDCETIRLDGGPVEADIAGRDDFPDSCVLVPAVAQGVAA